MIFNKFNSYLPAAAAAAAGNEDNARVECCLTGVWGLA